MFSRYKRILQFYKRTLTVLFYTAKTHKAKKKSDFFFLPEVYSIAQFIQGSLYQLVYSSSPVKQAFMSP